MLSPEMIHRGALPPSGSVALSCYTSWREVAQQNRMDVAKHHKAIKKCLTRMRSLKCGRRIDLPGQSQRRIGRRVPAIPACCEIPEALAAITFSSHDDHISATMNVASVRRPTGCLKAALRRTRYQRACQRSFTTTPRASSGGPFSGRQRTSEHQMTPTLQ